MIESQGLQFAYRDRQPLRFPDVSVPQGGVMVLRGRSGSGKSTWLALAAGLLSPGTGTIIVAGESPAAMGGSARDAWRARQLGFLPQKLHLCAALTVQANLALAFFAAGIKEDPWAVRHALLALGLDGLEDCKPSQISVGQAQRVALARAVMLNPKVLLADEPTASLDDEAAVEAITLLQACASRTGATLVVATHDTRAMQALHAHGTVHLLDLNETSASRADGILT